MHQTTGDHTNQMFQQNTAAWFSVLVYDCASELYVYYLKRVNVAEMPVPGVTVGA